jgi:integral membrane protein (TIGR01906 family)
MRLMRRVARFAGGTFVAVATVGVLVGAVVLALLTPLWVFGEQDRVRSAALTGYTPTEVRVATGAILEDLIVGPGDFDVTIRGQPVLSEAERGHMRNVRVTFQAFFAVIGVALVVLLVARWRSHGSTLFWRGVRAGSSVLAVAVAALAGFAIVAFTLLFEVFHELLFPPGSYTFDQSRDRLVQLFPEGFWFDTTIVLAIGLIVLALAVRALAGRRLRSLWAAASESSAVVASSPQAGPEPPAGSAPPVDPTPVET